VICILLLIACGVTSVNVIEDINNSVDDAIAKLNDMGLRRFLSISASLYSHNLLLIQSELPVFEETKEEVKEQLVGLGNTFKGLYDSAMDEDYASGPYKDINDDKALPWH
jgi:hypothetical protein